MKTAQANTWPVHMVTAFGRGETLALALQDNGFDVQVLDFSQAFGPEWNEGAGPFPIAAQSFLPAQKAWLEEVRPLERGLSFWLPGGPFELSGAMSAFYEQQHAFIRHLKQNTATENFADDWLRRFMGLWTSPFQWDAWADSPRVNRFPYGDAVGLIPATKEARVMTFERYKVLDYKYLACQALHDVQFEGGRITELELESGNPLAVTGQQWIWCLTSEETAHLGADVAAQLFTRGVRKPEWCWMCFHGRCDRGPWTGGFPEHTIVLNDIHLPWTHTNMFILRWTDVDLFNVWFKVPAATCALDERRHKWAREIRTELMRRLDLANWSVDPMSWSVSPHAPVYDPEVSEESLPAWKNWDWISGESLPRLDLSARLEREAASLQRLLQWRNDQLKKQGVRRDQALHAP